MLLAIDIGNTDIKVGLWDGMKWIINERIPSKPEQSELFYGTSMRDFFTQSSIPLKTVKRVILSSVVPTLNEKITTTMAALFEQEPIVVGPRIYSKLPIQILNPYEIGSDLVANAISAYLKFKQACVVVDFGTALTFTTISAEGKIMGVSIVPGLKTAIKALTQNAAQLFDVPLVLPTSALGTTTKTAIQTGIMIGYEGLIRTMVSAIRQELKEEALVVATGGLSFSMTSLKDFFFTIDTTLTLDGLRLIAECVQKR